MSAAVIIAPHTTRLTTMYILLYVDDVLLLYTCIDVYTRGYGGRRVPEFSRKGSPGNSNDVHIYMVYRELLKLHYHYYYYYIYICVKGNARIILNTPTRVNHCRNRIFFRTWDLWTVYMGFFLEPCDFSGKSIALRAPPHWDSIKLSSLDVFNLVVARIFPVFSDEPCGRCGGLYAFMRSWWCAPAVELRGRHLSFIGLSRRVPRRRTI